MNKIGPIPHQRQHKPHPPSRFSKSKARIMDAQEAVKRPQEEANGIAIGHGNGSNEEPAVKKVKLGDASSAPGDVAQTSRARPKGVAPIKEE
jgi:hypothetical protein